MNPLEHHSFTELLEHRRQEADALGCKFILQSYRYRYYFTLHGKYRVKWWHLITLVGVPDRLISIARRKGLLNVDGIHVCVLCGTSEYVRSSDKLNMGVPTCSRCGSHYNGWGE